MLIDDKPGEYGTSTTAAVLWFQAERGLNEDGVCGQQTWSAVVEAGYRLHDRLLYRRTPMLRGDDVADLQRNLSALGFDPGRIDGIFGDQTADALMDFQRNAGLAPDGICGHETLAEVLRLQPIQGNADLVSPLREMLKVATNGRANLKGRRIGVGEQGGFGAGVVSTCRALRKAGALGLPFHHPDPSSQAAEANAAGVDCFVNLVLVADERSCSTAYYRGYRYESLASRRLAELVQGALPAALGVADGGVRGMALPILRETRMPAIEVRLGAPVLVVQHTAELGRVLVHSLSRWITMNSA
jgi:N-acetylmuramoyl-L-alanine amidase